MEPGAARRTRFPERHQDEDTEERRKPHRRFMRQRDLVECHERSS